MTIYEKLDTLTAGDNLIKGVHSTPFLALSGGLYGFNSCGCISIHINMLLLLHLEKLIQ